MTAIAAAMSKRGVGEYLLRGDIVGIYTIAQSRYGGSAKRQSAGGAATGHAAESPGYRAERDVGNVVSNTASVGEAGSVARNKAEALP